MSILSMIFTLACLIASAYSTFWFAVLGGISSCLVLIDFISLKRQPTPPSAPLSPEAEKLFVQFGYFWAYGYAVKITCKALTLAQFSNIGVAIYFVFKGEWIALLFAIFYFLLSSLLVGDLDPVPYIEKFNLHEAWDEIANARLQYIKEQRDLRRQ